jgi:uncharacterized protein YegL
MSTPLRLTTENIKDQFNEADMEYNDETNVNFVNHSCSICFEDYLTSNILCTINCGHHSCKDCMVDYLSDNNTTCFTCRGDILTISNIDWGTISCSEFLDKCELENSLFHGRQCTGAPSRQYTSAPCRQLTQSNYDNSDYSYYDRQTKHNVILPEVPIQNISISSETNTDIISVLYSDQFAYKDTTLGTFILSSPFSDVVVKLFDIFLIIDVSGSMHGDRIKFCKEAAKTIVHSILNTMMRLTIITFDDYAVQTIPLSQVTDSNIDKILSSIDKIHSEGGTNYNVAFQFLTTVISNRDSIVMFLSDGSPSNTTNLTILRELYEKFPQLIMYVISMGQDVDSKDLVPLLCDRHFDAGIYKHITNEGDFPEFVETVIGESTSIYASDLNITFSGVEPISSKTEIVEDGISKISVPLLYSNNITQFAFTRNLDSILPISISVEYTKDGIVHTIVADFDSENILGDTLSKHFSLKRYLDREVNTILSRKDITNKTKYELIKNIYDEAVVNKDSFGIFFDEFDKGLSILMQDLTQISSRNYNIKNLVAQQSNRTGSLSRQVSSSISRTVTASRGVTQQPITEEDDELEFDIHDI